MDKTKIPPSSLIRHTATAPHRHIYSYRMSTKTIIVK